MRSKGRAEARANRRRADLLLVERGLAESRQRAQALILGGEVWCEGCRVAKPGLALAADAALEIRSRRPRYASRGGEKLAGALDHIGLQVGGVEVLDVGASTGGFTDCLLQRGARRVVALDVGRGQLATELRQDPRVELRERVNARYLRPEQFQRPFELIVVDLAFIGLAKVLPALRALLAPGGRLLALVKPQFEVGRYQVGRGGVVRDPERRHQALVQVAAAAHELGLGVQDALPSSVAGRGGNLEFFLLLVDGPGLARAPQAGLLRRIAGLAQAPQQGPEGRALLQ
jgi:23S rRNA (cytidine1920-2'-O)/16S rRNA (cytidine1409-2'-O)-methyltransferase